LNMSANNFKDLRRAGKDRRNQFGDRRDEDDVRRNDAGARKSAGTPKATTDRRSEGAARPDRFSRESSKIRRRHIWGPTALIVVAVGLATVELSGGYVSAFVTEQLTGSDYNTARDDGGSFTAQSVPDEKRTETRPMSAQTPSVNSASRGSGPAPGTSLARSMAIKEPTRALGAVDTSSCPPMPKVAIWGNLTHQRVINYVERRHAGDWTEYVDKWDRQAKKIRDIFDRGSAIRIGKNKIKIEGKQLAEYSA